MVYCSVLSCERVNISLTWSKKPGKGSSLSVIVSGHALGWTEDCSFGLGC